jgi:hypothetical protein
MTDCKKIVAVKSDFQEKYQTPSVHLPTCSDYLSCDRGSDTADERAWGAENEEFLRSTCAAFIISRFWWRRLCQHPAAFPSSTRYVGAGSCERSRTCRWRWRRAPASMSAWRFLGIEAAETVEAAHWRWEEATSRSLTVPCDFQDSHDCGRRKNRSYYYLSMFLLNS